MGINAAMPNLGCQQGQRLGESAFVESFCDGVVERFDFGEPTLAERPGRGRASSRTSPSRISPVRWICTSTPRSRVRAVVDGMRERRFSRIVNITSAMVTTPDPFMAASSGARTGTMAVMKGLQRQTVPDNVMINQLFPERIDSGGGCRWRVSRPNATGSR